MRRMSFLILACSFCIFDMSAHADDVLLKERQSKPLFGTVVTVEVCYSDGSHDVVRSAIERVWRRWEEIHARMNSYNLKSDVSLLNQAEGSPVWVHEDVARLIRASISFKTITRNTFDITIGPLTTFWKDQEKSDRIPLREELVKVKALVDANKVTVSGTDRVTLKQGMQIDLNGAAQGFAADEGVTILKQNGIRNFFVDAGGEIFASGVNCEGDPWRVGIKDPDLPKEFSDILALSDKAVSTSGNYEKFFKIQGKRFSRMINPLTGYPEADVVSATVIAPTALEADVFSTAVCILGPAKGLDLVNSLGEGYAAMVLSRKADGKVFVRYTTSGFEAFRKK
jgi:FAD:protein FMN transferase